MICEGEKIDTGGTKDPFQIVKSPVAIETKQGTCKLIVYLKMIE